MSDIRFNCAFCKQSIEAPTDMAGELIDCPQCQKTIAIPSHSTQPQPKSLPQRNRPEIKRASQPPTHPANELFKNKALVYLGAAIGCLIALFIVFAILRSKTESISRAAQESSQGDMELSARLIHKARYDELYAKWGAVNSMQQVGIGDADELRRAANNLERAMVIEFQMANPPDWIIEQQSEGVFEKNGGWAQYTFATNNVELIGIMSKRANESVSEMAREFNRQLSE